MKKTPKTRKTPFTHKKIVPLIVAAVLAIGFAGYLTYTGIGRSHDQNRFTAADKKKQTAFQEVIKKLGVPITTEEKNLCYQSEQGPYDNGNLWCQVASVAYFDKLQYSEAEIAGFTEAIIRENSWPVTNKRAAKVEFEGAKNLPCELIVEDGRYASDPGYHFTPNQQAGLAVIITCADRAKAKHYTYVE